MRRSILFAICVGAAGVFGACTEGQVNKPTPTPSPAPITSPTSTSSPTATGSPTASPAGSPVGKTAEAMVGRWTGPEGTYLNIAKKGDKYEVMIANLDGPKTYEGTAKDGTIQFTRSGKTESITPATGDDTGMKYLAGKKDCVVVTKGIEGFCRD